MFISLPGHQTKILSHWHNPVSTQIQCKNRRVKLSQILKDNQCKDTAEGQAINELLELFRRITELKTSEISGSERMGNEN